MSYTIHPMIDDPDAPPLWVILPGDGHAGYVVGEAAQVEELLQALIDWQQGKHGEEISEYSPRIGESISSRQAQAQAMETWGVDVPISSITHACREGHIPSQKLGRDWMFTFHAFSHWLHNRPKPGRKPAE